VIPQLSDPWLKPPKAAASNLISHGLFQTKPPRAVLSGRDLRTDSPRNSTTADSPFFPKGNSPAIAQRREPTVPTPLLGLSTTPPPRLRWYVKSPASAVATPTAVKPTLREGAESNSRLSLRWQKKCQLCGQRGNRTFTLKKSCFRRYGCLRDAPQRPAPVPFYLLAEEIKASANIELEVF